MVVGNQDVTFAIGLLALALDDAPVVANSFEDLAPTVCISARINLVPQCPDHDAIGGQPPRPYAATASRRYRQQHGLFQKPQQHLPCRADLEELFKHECNRMLHSAVRVLAQPAVFAHQVAGRQCRVELAALCLGETPCLSAMTKKVELIFTQGSLDAEQQTVVAFTWVIDAVFVNQQRVHDGADLHQLCPLAIIAREARQLARGHRTDLTQANLSEHPFKARTDGGATSTASQVIVGDLNLAPPEVAQSRLHGVLQTLTLEIVSHLLRC